MTLAYTYVLQVSEISKENYNISWIIFIMGKSKYATLTTQVKWWSFLDSSSVASSLSQAFIIRKNKTRPIHHNDNTFRLPCNMICSLSNTELCLFMIKFSTQFYAEIIQVYKSVFLNAGWHHLQYYVRMNTSRGVL
jgi:hypothetical protein